MTDLIDAFIIGVILAFIGFLALFLFSELATNPTLALTQGKALLANTGEYIVLLIVVGLPGGLLVAAILRGLGQ